MLTLQLRELERDGLIHCEFYRQVPPKVEHSLTLRGRSLEPIITRLNEWGVRYLAETTAGTTGPAVRDGATVRDEPAFVARGR